MTEPDSPIVDLTDVPLRDHARHAGDRALEATLERLKREAETEREAVSGFASAV
jgi:hypothetical protein